MEYTEFEDHQGVTIRYHKPGLPIRAVIGILHLRMDLHIDGHDRVLALPAVQDAGGWVHYIGAHLAFVEVPPLVYGAFGRPAVLLQLVLVLGL